MMRFDRCFELRQSHRGKRVPAGRVAGCTVEEEVGAPALSIVDGRGVAPWFGAKINTLVCVRAPWSRGFATLDRGTKPVHWMAASAHSRSSPSLPQRQVPRAALATTSAVLCTNNHLFF
jgi:hypothetical protein